MIFNGDGFLEEVVCRIFGTVLMNFLNDSFTAHLGLPCFLARCILLAGLSLIPACTSPITRTLRFDSPDWQLQWRDTGGTVLCQLIYCNTISCRVVGCFLFDYHTKELFYCVYCETHFSGRIFQIGPLLASKTATRPKIK